MGDLICKKNLVDNRQKKIEKYFFDKLFNSKAKEFQIAEWIPCEEPDCLVKLENGKIIGIEAFNYIRGQSGRKGAIERIEEEARFTVSKTISAILEEKYRGLLLCRAGFQANLSQTVQKKGLKLTDVSKAILNILEPNIKTFEEGDFKLSQDEICELEIDDYVSHLSFTKIPSAPDCVDFQHYIAGWGGFDFPAFQNTVYEKEPKIKEYLKQCEECWVMGFGHGPYLSSMVDILFVDDQEIDSGFRRVFIVNDQNEYKEFKNIRDKTPPP